MAIEDMGEEQVRALAALADTLITNPKTRLGVLQLSKIANPEQSIPEIDIPARLHGMLKERDDQIAALRKDNDDRATRDRILENRREALSIPGMTEDKIPDLEKLMVDKGISSHKTAAEFMTRQNQSAEPTPPRGSIMSYQLPTPDLKAFGGNMRMWARDQAARAIDEIRAGRLKVN